MSGAYFLVPLATVRNLVEYGLKIRPKTSLVFGNSAAFSEKSNIAIFDS
jgi:hypothetical protein